MTQVVTLKNTQGDIYEAIKEWPQEPWILNYPRGAQRFYGTRPQVTALLKSLIKVHLEEDAE